MIERGGLRERGSGNERVREGIREGDERDYLIPKRAKAPQPTS